uniref:INCENP_ARK-bind domain-containing protein n=1 Tax=Panagrellus redivivus TaxID=6233 RepID=A0A7E4V2V1_PANRE
MPPKKTAPKQPAVPLDGLYAIAATVDLAEINRNHPVIALLQRGFREAAAYNDEARELIQNQFAVRPPATPKKKREKLNRVVEEIEHLIAPVALNFDELDDGQEPASPRQPASPIRSRQATPRPVFTASRPTPKKQPINKGPPAPPPPPVHQESPKKRVPVIAKPVAPPATRIPKPPPSRKNTKAAEQKSRDEDGHMTAEERKRQALHEKAERARLEREEKEAKVRERQRQIEEEKKRVADGFRNQLSRLKKFEDVNKTPCSPRTITREGAKAQEVITPRRVHVPIKKGRDLVKVEFDGVIVGSPQLKRKTAGKRQKTNDAEVLEPTPEPTHSRHRNAEPEPQMQVDPEPEPEDVVMVEGELHYEEVTPEEALFYNNAFQNADLESFEQHEADVQHDAAQAVQSEELFDQPPAQPVPSEDLFAPTPPRAARNDDIFAPTPTVALSQPTSDVYKAPATAAAEPAVEFHDAMDVEGEDEEEDDAANNYEMTLEKVYKPATAENYNLEDLSSNDETDDECKPRKEVPKWARRVNLHPAVIDMEERYTIDQRAAFFGVIQQPSVELLFGRRTNRARQSSQVWNSPFAKPTPGFSRLPR